MSYLYQSAPTAQPPGPPTITPDDLAAPWRRIVAAIVDGLILGLPIGLLVGFWAATQTDALDGGESVDLLPMYLLAGLAGFLYQVPPVAIWGQTLGKKVLGIRVVSGQDLTLPGWWRAVRRWGIYVVLGLIPIVGGLVSCFVLPVVGLVMLFVHQKRQVPHDLVADTIVVNDGIHVSA